MAGRNKIFNEEEVIDRAIEIFWQRGYEPSSTDELLAAMGIGKGSFYHSFPGGKKELFEKALDQFSKSELAKFRAKLQSTDQPLEEIRNFFRSICDSEIEAHEKGCFLGNTIAELSNTDYELKNKAVQLLRELEITFYGIIKETQKKNQITNPAKPELLAKYLINLWNGLGITRRMNPDKIILRELVEMQLEVLR
jgi:TetR/AcrR family transcriptional regulator, transcriptional repressor for nem operon